MLWLKMALLILHVGWIVGGAKANVPFVCWCLNYKIFARGQSPDRKHRVFLSRLSCQRCRIIFVFVHLAVMLIFNGLPITARQYGEVVLPDAASGQGPCTLARKLSRCKEGMARVFAVQVQILLSITCVAVQG
jgi:hypothetical protein